jgi:hypothetical protein
MRKVRYNDKLWFGKHKGHRVCSILENDPSYIQKLQREHGIVFDEKILNYFKSQENYQTPKTKKIIENHNDIHGYAIDNRYTIAGIDAHPMYNDHNNIDHEYTTANIDNNPTDYDDFSQI